MGKVVALGPHDVCSIAAEAGVDHRTVEGFLQGSPGKARVRIRIFRAMCRLGFQDLIPDRPELVKCR